MRRTFPIGPVLSARVPSIALMSLLLIATPFVTPAPVRAEGPPARASVTVFGTPFSPTHEDNITVSVTVAGIGASNVTSALLTVTATPGELRSIPLNVTAPSSVLGIGIGAFAPGTLLNLSIEVWLDPPLPGTGENATNLSRIRSSPFLVQIADLLFVRWHYGSLEAFALSARLDRPVLIVFCSDSSAPCRDLDDQILTVPKILEATSGFVMLRIESGTNEDLAQRYSVKVEPTMVFVAPDGRVLHRTAGARTADQFAGDMAFAAGGRHHPPPDVSPTGPNLIPSALALAVLIALSGVLLAFAVYVTGRRKV